MQGLGCLVRDEKGAVTIEFTMLVPYFIFLMIFFADAAVMYLTHSEMYNVARDAARRMATGQLKTQDDVAAYAATHLFLGSRTYNVHTGFGNTRFVAVEVPVYQAAIFGFFFRPILGENLIATATMVRERPLLPLG